LKSIDESSEITAISSWYTLEDWQTWFESEERKEIQSRIDAIPGVTTEYAIYRYIKTR
jgi:heme-degrading monooxygenase HmoA